MVRSTLLSLALASGTVLGAFSSVWAESKPPPHIFGSWSGRKEAPVVAIHVALLPNGKVLLWPRTTDDKGKPLPEPISHPRLWDPATEEFSAVPRPPYNIFCAGHSFLPNGQLFLAGGHITDFEGDRKAAMYDPLKNSWTLAEPMNAGRWYPSCVTLPSGEVLVVGGTLAAGKFNKTPQVWNVGPYGQWRNLTKAEAVVPYYPMLHVAPNGQVFMSGPEQKTRYLDHAGLGRWIPVADRTLKDGRDYGSSVMYEPGKILAPGGGIPPMNTAEIIDLNDSKPAWHRTDSMKHARRHQNAVLLADGTVCVLGGTATSKVFKDKKASDNDATGAVMDAELWDPKTGRWTTLAYMIERRLYHSTGLLLPDGRVLSAGGGEPWGDGEKADHRNYQIFEPPYLHHGPRPVITKAPAKVAYDANFRVDFTAESKIRRVSFIRLGSATHAFDFNQRYVRLSHFGSGKTIGVKAPPNANVAPPGHYLLFILDEKGVPSVAKIVQLG